LDIADILLFNVRMGASFRHLLNRLFYSAAPVILLGLFLYMPVAAHALGFASPVLESHLGQPLKARIPLQLDATESMEQITVELASPTEYLQLGLQWFDNIASIRVGLQRDAAGKPQVELTSATAIKAPFLSIVLKARKSGKSIYFRHFQIRLSPAPKAAASTIATQPESIAARLTDAQSVVKPAAPVVKAQTAKPPVPAVKKQAIKPSSAAARKQAMKSTAPAVKVQTGILSARQQVARKKKPVRKKKSVRKSSARKTSAATGWARIKRYGPTRAGVSLSQVAASMRKDKRWSNRQVMLALYLENPDAFVGGNINRLRRGSRFRAPSARKIGQYSVRAADRKIRYILKHPPRRTKAKAKKAKHAVAMSGKKHPVSKARIKAAKPAPVVETERATEPQDDKIFRIQLEQLQSIQAEIEAGKSQMDAFAQALSDIGKPMSELKDEMQHLAKEIANMKEDVASVKEKVAAIKNISPASNDDSSNYGLIALLALLAASLGVAFGRKARRTSGKPLGKRDSTSSDPVETGDTSKKQVPKRDLSI